MAERLWMGGHGELPPQWDYETDEHGEVYYLTPSGETQWDDPRDTLQLYTQEFIAAEARGVDLVAYFSR